MISFFVQLIIAAVILVIALWAIAELLKESPGLQRVLRVIAIAAFLIWLLIRGLPLLGVS